MLKLTSLLLLFFVFNVSISTAQQSNHKVIVPAYVFPYDNDNPGQHDVGPYWSMLIEAAKIHKDRLVVIANVNNGPGAPSNTWAVQKYTEAITKVRQAGGIVLGYVHLCYGLQHNTAECNGRTQVDIEQDISNWHLKYNVDGYFFDEAPNTLDKLSWLQNIDQKTRTDVGENFDILFQNADGSFETNPNRKLYMVMHYGTMPPPQFTSTNYDWIHSVCERPVDLFPAAVNAQPDIQSALQAVSYNQNQLQGKSSAVILYQKSGLSSAQQNARVSARLDQELMALKSYDELQMTWDDARDEMLNSGFDYLYITNDGPDGNPWDSLPSFLMQLF